MSLEQAQALTPIMERFPLKEPQRHQYQTLEVAWFNKSPLFCSTKGARQTACIPAWQSLGPPGHVHLHSGGLGNPRPLHSGGLGNPRPRGYAHPCSTNGAKGQLSHLAPLGYTLLGNAK